MPVRVTRVVIEDNRIVLLNQDTGTGRAWSLPGGKVEDGETLSAPWCGKCGKKPAWKSSRADQQAGRILPHVHVTLGLKERAADGYTSHLLDARVQFLVEMILVEVAAPAMTRPADPALYDVPRLSFGGR